jgi:hypothetical protein
MASRAEYQAHQTTGGSTTGLHNVQLVWRRPAHLGLVLRMRTVSRTRLALRLPTAFQTRSRRSRFSSRDVAESSELRIG